MKYLLSVFIIFYSFQLSSQSIIYTYDNLNRLVKIEYPDKSIINYQYDANGNRGSQIIENICYHKPLPIVSTNGPTTFCVGESVALTASSGISYLWNTGETTQMINVASPGIYTVLVTDTDGCIIRSLPTEVVVNPLPMPVIEAEGATTICSGESVVFRSSIDAVTYLWSNGATTKSVVIDTPGTYSVAVRDSNGCSNTSPSVNVTLNELPTPLIEAKGATTFCAGNTVTLESSIDAVKYEWNNSEPTKRIEVKESGTFSLTVTDANGCKGTSPEMIVTVHPLPTPSIEASGPTIFCEGEKVTLASSISGESYKWNTNEVSKSISVSNSGDYSVAVTDANGCTGLSSIVTVKVNPLPTPKVVANGPTSFCLGESIVLNSSISAKSYVWNTNATSSTINVTNSGSYFVTVTDDNGCKGTSEPLIIEAYPLPVVSAGDDVKIIIGASIQIGGNPTASGDGPFTYSWSPSSGLNFPNIANPIASPDDSTIYEVTVIDAKGCVNKDAVLVEVNVISGFAIFPNPTDEVINLTGAKIQNGRYKLYLNNLKGQSIFSDEFEVANNRVFRQYSIKSYPTGVYVLAIDYGNERKTFKVIKED